VFGSYWAFFSRLYLNPESRILNPIFVPLMQRKRMANAEKGFIRVAKRLKRPVDLR
jgi:hypothetical protein